MTATVYPDRTDIGVRVVVRPPCDGGEGLLEIGGGYYRFCSAGPLCYRLLNLANGKTYDVDLRGGAEQGCDCADAVYRGRQWCKHRVAMRRVEGGEV